VVAPVIVVIDKGADLTFEIAGQEVVLQQNAALECLMPAFDLALRLGMVRCATHMVDTIVIEPACQIAGDVGRTIVAEQARFACDVGLAAARGLERHCQRLGDIVRLHRGAQLQCNDISRVIVEDGGEVEPSPADDLQVGEVSLPELVWRCRFIGKLISCLEDDVGRAGDEVLGLEQPVGRRFRDEVASRVGEGHRQFPG